MKLLNTECLGSQTLSYPSLLLLQCCLERSYSTVTRERFVSSSRCSSDKFWFHLIQRRIGVLQDLGTELRQLPASYETVLHRREAGSNVLSLCCVIFRCCGEVCPIWFIFSCFYPVELLSNSMTLCIHFTCKCCTVLLLLFSIIWNCISSMSDTSN